jgi:ATP-dependent DNA helicase RecG
MSIARQIKKGESESLEFKESFDKEAIESVCAMANRNGGTVLIGVTDKGIIKGATVGKETLPQWLNQISSSTEPRLTPLLTAHKILGKTVVSIEIASYPIKPIFYNGRAFLRSTSSNRKLNAREISDLHNKTTHTSWDALPSDKKLSDLNITLIKSFLSRIKKSNRRNLKGISDWKKALIKLELIIKNKPTWACFLLFKKNIAAQPHSVVRVARFKGSSYIIDDNFIEGALISQAQIAMNAIIKNLRVQYVIKHRSQRDEVLEYPVEAIREALLNSICHRDYTDSADILIKIYDDHLSIWNPGKLPHNLSIAQLLKNEHASRPRNKLITQAFYDMGDIERLGSGIKRIMDSCKQAGLPNPEIKEEEGGFYVIFKRPQNDIYDTVSYVEEAASPYGNIKKLSLREKKVINYLKKKGRIDNSDYQRLFKVSKRAASANLAKLMEEGIIRREGKKGKGTFYVLIKPSI